MSKFAAH